jgi:hypothetical protein
VIKKRNEEILHEIDKIDVSAMPWMFGRSTSDFQLYLHRKSLRFSKTWLKRLTGRMNFKMNYRDCFWGNSQNLLGELENCGWVQVFAVGWGLEGRAQVVFIGGDRMSAGFMQRGTSSGWRHLPGLQHGGWWGYSWK